jgi:hypothetical protein
MIDDADNCPWSDELQCRYLSWTATNLTTLLLRTPDEHNKCDMAGCIRVAKQLMPDVSKIIVFEGGRLGCVYTRKGIKWTSGREF